MKDLDLIYCTARELPPEERPAYLTKDCGDDIELRTRVEQMLAVSDEAEAFIADLPEADLENRKPGREAVKDLASRARNKRMKPEEFQGGTFTVSNLGSYGIDYFSAIINPPQAIILSIGAIVRQPVLDAAGSIVPGYRMKIGMSCDHRVVDGAIGANYLKALRHLLENPSLLLL
jgi:pyruvate dehydrogenase E2 component (dihydrolipoamide acetyltransferase)